MDCKKLIYHPTRQEAIAPVNNRLMKWDVSTNPPQIFDEFPVAFQMGTIPAIAFIETMDAMAIAPKTTTQEHSLELRLWETWQLISTIPLDHQAYEETSIDDQFCQHSRCCAISALTLAYNSRYLVALEPFGDLHLIDLHSNWQSPHIIRWPRLVTDYSEAIAFDPQGQFFVQNTLDQDTFFEFFRIDDVETAQLSYYDQFEGGVSCYRGALTFSPFADAIVHTDYFSRQSRLVYRHFDRLDLLSRDAAEENHPEPWGAIPVWEQQQPLICHPHDSHHPWQSSIAFVDEHQLIWAAGEALVLLNIKDGSIAADYHTQVVTQDIAFDGDRRRVIVATTEGIITVALNEFDPTATYTKLSSV